MTVNALIRMGVVWMRNVRLNRAKRSYRQILISNIPNPVPLKPVDLKSGFHQMGLLKLQQFNTWHFGEHKFTILERSHPKVYARLLKKKGMEFDYSKQYRDSHRPQWSEHHNRSPSRSSGGQQ